jgi:hypothetical protein
MWEEDKTEIEKKIRKKFRGRNEEIKTQRK